jgi:GDP/UDP-N,N'-diacetylbacillosamine 2-epimerase (hydrolysing)
MVKKIIAITGIRSEFDILYPILVALNNDPNFDLKLVISGSHLSDWHGNILEQIRKEGFRIADKVDSLLMTNRNTQRVKGIGMLMIGLSQTVEREEPDFLIVIGDREESIATALVGNYMNKLVVHFGGGDPVYGNADDPIRFAVSKLSHVHFTNAQLYADNLINSGEEKYRVFNVGNPAYKNIIDTPYFSLNQVSEFLNFDISDGKYLVLLKHPLSSEIDQTYEQMSKTLHVLEDFCIGNNYKLIGIYPNTDPGSYDILDAIKLKENNPLIKFFKNIPREYFINIMRNCSALIGNSSMGILEAPFYKIPVINIGNRQLGRLNAGNVEFVNYDSSAIYNALKKACFDIDYIDYIKNLENPYGNGDAVDKIVDVLNNIDINDNKWHVKKKLC